MKKNIFLLILFIALLLVALGLKKATEYKPQEINGSQVLNYTTKIDKIEIKKSEKEADVLVKIKDIWQIASQNNLPVDPDLINKLTEIVENLVIKNKVSENEAKYADFEVTAEKGVEVKFYQKDKLVSDFIIGKEDWQQGGTYLKKEKDKAVYLTNESIRYIFSQPDWRDLNLTKILKDDISSINITGIAGNVVALEKKDNKWQINQKELEQAKQDKLNSLLDEILVLKAADLKLLIEIKINAEAKYQITVKYKDGEESFAIFESAEDKENYFVKKENQAEAVYLILKTKVEELEKKAGEIR